MKKSGGKRKNVGRKPVADKKQQVCLYIKASEIKKLGGLEAIKAKIHAYVERTALRS